MARPAEAVDAALHYARTHLCKVCWPLPLLLHLKLISGVICSFGPFHGRLSQRRDKDQTLALLLWYLPYRALTCGIMQCDRLASSSHPKQAVSSLHQDDARLSSATQENTKKKLASTFHPLLSRSLSRLALSRLAKTQTGGGSKAGLSWSCSSHGR